jgi:iron complex outermembrane receptor protein
VSGAVEQTNPRNQPWVLFGANGQTHTAQDHLKVKLAYDLTPTLRASALLGVWRNDAERVSETFLADAMGAPVWSGTVNVNGRSYALTPADFAPSSAQLEHRAQSLSLKQHGGAFQWSATVSSYRYAADEVRTPTVAMPAALGGGAGRITDLDGTGWTSLAGRASWRPDDVHLLEGGVQRDAFRLKQRVDNTADWRAGDASTPVSSFAGRSTLTSLWAQDTIRPEPDWRFVLGARVERWRAFDGAINGSGLPARQEDHLSPKAAAWNVAEAWTLKASLGRAVRMPTVSELFQGSVANNVIVNNDPNLQPEKSWTTEWSAEHAAERWRWRGTLFAEYTADALYSQTNVTVTPAVTNIQNIDAIRTRGFETVVGASGVGLPGLDLDASLTYADSIILRNDKFPASVGHWQPRVPRWRATVLASYAIDERASASLGVRYSGRQYGQLDNSDTNEQAYTGFSRFLVVDARVQVRLDRQWRASVGIDNLTNAVYWAFHPYPQRTLHAELRWDL